MPTGKSLWQYIVPAHLAQKVGWNHGFDGEDMTVVVSGGPFKIQSYDKGNDLVLIPNDRYWATPPNLDSIDFRFIPDPTQQVAGLQSKTVDMIHAPAQVDTVSAVKATPGINSQISFGGQLVQLAFNASTPGLGDVTVRKAIATAIDRPSIIQATVGQFGVKSPLVNNRIYANQQPDYRDSSGGLYDHGDIVTAKQMIEQDGYQLGADGVYTKGGVKLSFRISTAAAGELGASAAVLLQTELRQCGIQLTVDGTSGPVVLPAVGPSQAFDLALVTSPGTPFPSSLIPLYDQVGTVPGQPGNAVLDQYLGYGATQLDAARRANLLNDADSVMWENMWTLPLYQVPTFLAVRNTFVNIHENVTSEGPFWNAQTWGLKASTPTGSPSTKASTTSADSAPASTSLSTPAGSSPSG